MFNVWIRATGRLPDDPAIHQCVLAYASDMTLLDASLVAHGRTVFERSIQPASLDHALWFHRPFRADEWLLYAQDSPNASGARGFSRGLIFAETARWWPQSRRRALFVSVMINVEANRRPESRCLIIGGFRRKIRQNSPAQGCFLA